MWRDSNGFKQIGPSPYLQRRLEEYRKSVENEELKEHRLKEEFIKRACGLLEDIDFEMTYIDGEGLFNKEKFITDFRKAMENDI